MEKICKEDVFKSLTYYPAEWKECLNIARKRGYKYIDFNGCVLTTDDDKLDYNNTICQREDLI